MRTVHRAPYDWDRAPHDMMPASPRREPAERDALQREYWRGWSHGATVALALWVAVGIFVTLLFWVGR